MDFPDSKAGGNRFFKNSEGGGLWKRWGKLGRKADREDPGIRHVEDGLARPRTGGGENTIVSFRMKPKP